MSLLNKKYIILSLLFLTVTTAAKQPLYAGETSNYSFMPDVENESTTEDEEDFKAKIQSLSIGMDGEKVVISGKTNGFTDKMLLSIKVFDSSEQIKYFDVVSLNKNNFSLSFIPKDTSVGESLMLKIDGDLSYSEEFAYGESKDSNTGLIFDSTLLIDYIKNQLGQFVDYAGTLSFDYEVTLSKNNLTIKMKGTDFQASDPSWLNRNQARWKSYLEIIADKALDLYNIPVSIQVTDKNNVLIDSYSKSVKPGQGMSAEDMKILLNKEYSSFVSSNGTLRFTYEVTEGKTAYAITMNGKFNAADDIWKKLDKKELNSFISKIGQNLEYLVYKDLKFTILDNKGSTISQMDYFVNNKAPTKNYLYFETLNDAINAQKPDINSKPAQNILDLIQYGGVSLSTDDIIVNSNTQNTQVLLKNAQLSKSKVKPNQNLIIKVKDVSDNYNFTISSDFVATLINQSAKLVLATTPYEVIIDFAGSSVPFTDLTVEMRKDTFGNYFVINEAVVSSLKMAPKGVIRYSLTETEAIQDTRTLAVAKLDGSGQNGSIVPYNLKIDKQGIQFDYSGAGYYALKNNEKYFSDMTAHWGKNQIGILSAKEIIEGIGDYKYAPERTITRAEFIAMMMRNLGFTSQTSINYFKDVTSNDWYYHVVNIAKNMGVLPPTYNDKLNPNEPIVREEMIYIAIECYKLNPNLKQVGPTAIFYKDRSSVSPWAVENVSKASELGIARGYENMITPKDTATRAEAAQILINLLEKQYKL